MVSRCKRYYAAAQQIPDQPAAYLTSFRDRGSGILNPSASGRDVGNGVVKDMM